MSHFGPLVRNKKCMKTADHFESICTKCRRVCFSPSELEQHPCFEMNDLIKAEIALCADGKRSAEIFISFSKIR